MDLETIQSGRLQLPCFGGLCLEHSQKSLNGIVPSRKKAGSGKRGKKVKGEQRKEKRKR